MYHLYFDIKRLIQEQLIYSKQRSQDDLLEKIWLFHTRYNPIDAPEIRENILLSCSAIKNLSLKKQHELLHVIANLCVEHERVAFTQGICVGMQLAHEVDAVEKEMNINNETE